MYYYVKKEKKKNIPKEQFEQSFVICECGYNNKKYFVDKSGICNRCGEILDDRAHFKSELNKILRPWRKK